MRNQTPNTMNPEFNFETNFEYYIDIITDEGYGEQITSVVIGNEAEVEEFNNLIGEYQANGSYLRYEIL
jgi:hypothetical protein